MRRHLARWVGPFISVVLFVFACFALRRFLSGTSVTEILEQARAVESTSIAAAIGLTALSYFVLTFYDVLALRYVGRPLPYPKTARSSFVSYALSHNLGMSFLSGGAARYRLYSRMGVNAVQATFAVFFCNFTFWVGFITLGGVVLAFFPLPLPPESALSFADSRPIGWIALGCLAVVSGGVALGRARLSIGSFQLPLPSRGIFAGQIVVSVADWIAAAAVLHALLGPATGLGFFTVLQMFLLAQILGMVSNLPQGIGVFESVLLFLLPESVDPTAALGAVVVYRVVYYLLPLAAALPLLFMHELRRGLAR